MNKLLIYKYPVTKTNVQEIAHLKYLKLISLVILLM